MAVFKNKKNITMQRAIGGILNIVCYVTAPWHIVRKLLAYFVKIQKKNFAFRKKEEKEVATISWVLSTLLLNGHGGHY